MKISGWGRYPFIDTEVITATSGTRLQEIISSGFQGIPRGLGRSYGDSSLAGQVLDVTGLNDIINFDKERGVISCRAGLSISGLLEYCVPEGWFLPVTPGTKFVTIGGAIASDVHGKNHHVLGAFSDHVIKFQLLLPDGSILLCSRDEHTDLFHATCGGMGLTGVILEAELQLMPVNSSFIRETVWKAGCLTELLDLLVEHGKSTYSVAWIDCMAAGAKIGRSLLMLGEHSEEGGLIRSSRTSLTVPPGMPGFLLNSCSISIFNWIYYHRKRNRVSSGLVHYEPFFYPLDRILHWNRLYGRRGFVQYQIVLPEDGGEEGITLLIKKIVASGLGSFLGVLKKLGGQNDNLLSFPTAGYTLALDFRLRNETLHLLDKLDEVVLNYGGRIYLAKDARMNARVFRAGYPRWTEFLEIRKKYKTTQKLYSLQSRRLGI